MAWAGGVSSRRFTRAKAAWTRRTRSRSSVPGRARSWGVWAQANAPTSIGLSPATLSRGDSPHDLVEGLVGQRPYLLARERLDRVGHHDGLVVRGAERLGLGARGANELGRDDRRDRDAAVLEEHAVVHNARCARPSVGEPLDDDVGRADDLLAEDVGRRPREGRLLPPDDGLRRRALAQEFLEAVEQMVPLRFGDVEQRDDLAVEARRPRRRLAWNRDGIGGVEILRHRRILLKTRLEPFENVQPGTIAEKRPAVPPATTTLMFSGARNLGIIVVSRAGSRNFASTCSGSPSPPSRPGRSSRTGHWSRSWSQRRTSAFFQPASPRIFACSGESTSSVSPQCVIR